MNNRKRRLLMTGIAVGGVGAAPAAVLLTGSPQHDGDDLQGDRQEAVAERGQTVMPFDLEQTTHHS
ncbi:hypothetical protein [Streptomyces sp. 2A115]|uniref:hypothetical protein n=1 Tax=Streptomyces sp. 2A115 TaxID=3457439 RepID=UPI003FD18BDA